MSGQNKQDGWQSRFGVILAVTGSAVGLGNFLRFPGLAAKYEGGAFLIPYFIALLLLGLPIAWVEWTMGRYGGRHGYNSTPGIFRLIWPNPVSPYLGVLGLIVPVVIYMYYVFIESWCLGYAFYYLMGALDLGKSPDAYAEFFNRYVGITGNGVLFTPDGWSTLAFLLVCVVLNFIIIYRGIGKGIEWFCIRAMPALVVCALLVLVRILTLGTPDPARPELNVWNALGYMWNPRVGGKTLLESLANGQMWLDAAGQIFFSLSVGFGVVITYASYLKKDDDIALSSTTAVAGNEWCEVALGGMMTVPAAFLFFGATFSVSLFSLGFTTLPVVFAYMPLGNLFGFLFFFLLFLAAITSSLSMLQPAIAFLEEGLGLDRKGSVSLLGFMTVMGTGFVVYFSEGLIALDTFDFWVGTFCIYTLATVQVLLFGWVLGTDTGMDELTRGAEIRIPRVVGFVIKYVSPVYLIVIFAFWIWQNLGANFENIAASPVIQISLGFIAIIAGTFLLLINQAVKRWVRKERAAAPPPSSSS